MDSDEPHHARLVETAAAAHRHAVAVNLASAVRSLYSADKPTPAQAAEVAIAEAAVAAADRALADWRSPEARLARRIPPADASS